MRADDRAHDWLPGARAALGFGAGVALVLLALFALLGVAFGELPVRAAVGALLAICIVSCLRMWRADREAEHELDAQLDRLRRRQRPGHPAP